MKSFKDFIIEGKKSKKKAAERKRQRKLILLDLKRQSLVKKKLKANSGMRFQLN